MESDVTVKISEEVLEKKLQIAGVGKKITAEFKNLVKEITPMLVNIPLELNPPTLEDSTSDHDRLNRGIDKTGIDITRMSIGMKVMRELADVMRDENWNVTATVVKKKCSNEVLRVVPGNSKIDSLGVAVDIGTTSIVVYLVDMEDGTILAATSGHNRQAACGDDVINRIVCAEKDGVKKLSDMVLSTINGLINEAIHSVKADRNQIDNVVMSGNTTMTHLMLGLEPRHIRCEPYIPSVSAFPIIKAKDIGLKVNPVAAVFVMPGPASYVGGDIVSGLLYTGLHREEPLTMFIDVGTNGEIVLENKDWLMTASCSAGLAFEGGGVRWEMPAEDGAIEKVSIDPETFDPSLTVIGNISPRGICGSGIIDLISEMLLKSIIQPNGKINIDSTHPRYAQNGDEKAYIVAFSNETSVERDIIFTETDIYNIIRSKGAIYAGFIVLLNQVGMDFSMVEQVIITGGFGQYLDIDKAVTIGLLPDIERNKFRYMGNSSIAGAYMALLSEEYRKEALEISNSMTYIDFSSNNKFMHELTSALFLPHTNLKEFPSVEEAIK